MFQYVPGFADSDKKMVPWIWTVLDSLLAILSPFEAII
jgi:hypothetical protein